MRMNAIDRRFLSVNVAEVADKLFDELIARDWGKQAATHAVTAAMPAIVRACSE